MTLKCKLQFNLVFIYLFGQSLATKFTVILDYNLT